MIDREVPKLSQNEIDKKLYKTIWRREAETIDLSLFDSEDQILIIKCKEQLPITVDELESLRKIFSSYTKMDKKFNIKTAEKNVEQIKEIISTEQALLDLADNNQPVPLIKKYKQNGKIVEIKLLVKPVLDSRSNLDVVSHTKMFNKLNDQEKQVLEKQNTLGDLNERELKILTRINEKLEGMITQTDNFIFIVENTLSRQVDFQDGSLPDKYEDRMEFWSKVNSNIKVDIYNSVNAIIKDNNVEFFR